jgi:transcription-repair coupling factor (superfamily II helicase)
MTSDAVKRLAVIQEHSELGQGFKVAMRDMEIRGAGNILGASQSGHVNQVGYEMYLQLLEETVREIKGEPPEERVDPEIHLKVEAFIPEDYIPEVNQRMNFYKRLSRASSQAEIDGIEEEIVDLYGRSPEQVNALFGIMKLRLVMKELRILKLDYVKGSLVISFDQSTTVTPGSLIKWVQKEPSAQLAPGDKLIYQIGLIDSTQRANVGFKVLSELLNLTKDETIDETSLNGNSVEPKVKYKLFKKKVFSNN